MLDELGRITDEPGCLTRTFLSPAMKRANALVGGWMGLRNVLTTPPLTSLRDA